MRNVFSTSKIYTAGVMVDTICEDNIPDDLLPYTTIHHNGFHSIV